MYLKECEIGFGSVARKLSLQLRHSKNFSQLGAEIAIVKMIRKLSNETKEASDATFSRADLLQLRGVNKALNSPEIEKTFFDTSIFNCQI